MSGFVLVHRQLLENPAFRTQGEAMAFAWLILRASWKPAEVRYKGHVIQLKRGQLALSVRDFAGHFDRSKDWANRFLSRLRERAMIATDSGSGVLIITLCNYDKYQAEGEYCEVGGATAPRQKRDTTATQNKEGKKGTKDSPNGESTPTPFAAPQPEWTYFVEHRKQIGNALTPRAVKLALAKLETLAAEGHDPRRVIEQSIMNRWTGLFPIKENRNERSHRDNGESKTLSALRSVLADHGGDGPPVDRASLNGQAQGGLASSAGGSGQLALPGPTRANR